MGLQTCADVVVDKVRLQSKGGRSGFIKTSHVIDKVTC